MWVIFLHLTEGLGTGKVTPYPDVSGSWPERGKSANCSHDNGDGRRLGRRYEYNRLPLLTAPRRRTSRS